MRDIIIITIIGGIITAIGITIMHNVIFHRLTNQDIQYLKAENNEHHHIGGAVTSDRENYLGE